MQSRVSKDRVEVRIAGESVSVKLANLQFQGSAFPTMVFHLEGLGPNLLGAHAEDGDMRKQGLVLDKFMRVKYMDSLTPTREGFARAE